MQANILGHIRNLFKANVPEVEQSTFYVLALLNGIELRMNYLMNWFGISKMVIQELERDGWCTVDQENMTIGIPHLIVHAFGEDEFKKVTELRTFKIYISNLSKTLNRREIQPTDVGIMQQVIQRIHDVFFVQLRKKISMLDESIYEFHFSCIRYYLYYGNAVQAEQLGTLKSLEIDEKYKSHVYEHILLTIKDYIGKDDLARIYDDIIDLLNTKAVFSSYFGTLAFLDMIYLWSENTTLRCIGFVMEFKHTNPKHIKFKYTTLKRVQFKRINPKRVDFKYAKFEYAEYRNIKLTINRLREIYGVIISMEEKNRDYGICVQLKFYSDVFDDFTYSEYYSPEVLCQRIQSWNSIEEAFDSSENKTVNDVEKKIYTKSVILVLYELFYLITINLINQRNNKDDILSGKIHGNLKSHIRDTSERLIELRDCIGELPCYCAGVCILSCGLAGVILHDKSLMKIREYDYKHVAMYNQNHLDWLQKVIACYRKWGDTEE